MDAHNPYPIQPVGNLYIRKEKFHNPVVGEHYLVRADDGTLYWFQITALDEYMAKVRIVEEIR